MKKLLVLFLVFAFLAQAYLKSTRAQGSAISDFPDSSKKLIQEKLLKPLAKKEKDHPIITRETPAPKNRRVRILDKSPQKDSLGDQFLTFWIYESYLPSPSEDRASDWEKDVIVGCVYPKTEKIFIQQREVYYPSSILLGERADKAPANVCRSQ